MLKASSETDQSQFPSFIRIEYGDPTEPNSPFVAQGNELHATAYP